MVSFEQKYLDEFSYLGDRIYLDWCAAAVQPQRTLDFCRTFQQEFVDSMAQICFGPYGEMRESVKKRLAGMIGASPDEIQFAQNTTEGDNLLMHAYPFRPGDSVVVSNFDYPSVCYGWYQLQSKGICVHTVKAINGAVRAEDVIAAIDSTTKAVAISQVQYMSGYRTDLQMIGDYCHDRGILLIVDGIQGLGRNPVDVKKMHISVYSCGGFKGMLGVLGAAFYYVDADLIPLLEPQWYSSNVDTDEHAFPSLEEIRPLPYHSGIRRLDGGSLNTYGILALGKGAELICEIGPERIHRHVLELEAYLRRRIAEERIPVHFLGDDCPDHWSGTPCFTFDLSKASALEMMLKKHKIYVSLRKFQEEGMVRTSFHFPNTEAQVERLLEVLKEVLA